MCTQVHFDLGNQETKLTIDNYLIVNELWFLSFRQNVTEISRLA